MKKLMIAAAIVCAAAVSQAAYVTWGFNSATWAEETDAKVFSADYSAYLIQTANFDATDIAGSIAKADASVAYADWTTKDNEPGWVSYGWGAEISSTSATAGTYAYTLLVTDGKTDYAAYNIGSGLVYDDNRYQPTDAEKAYTEAFTGGSTYMAQSDFTAVPEPTSGLLLLLGVAGLALRRRRV